MQENVPFWILEEDFWDTNDSRESLRFESTNWDKVFSLAPLQRFKSPPWEGKLCAKVGLQRKQQHPSHISMYIQRSKDPSFLRNPRALHHPNHPCKYMATPLHLWSLSLPPCGEKPWISWIFKAHPNKKFHEWSDENLKAETVYGKQK